jgi:hypothetical protein
MRRVARKHCPLSFRWAPINRRAVPGYSVMPNRRAVLKLLALQFAAGIPFQFGGGLLKRLDYLFVDDAPASAEFDRALFSSAREACLNRRSAHLRTSDLSVCRRSLRSWWIAPLTPS